MPPALPLTLPVLGFACKPTSGEAVTPRGCGRKEHISMLPPNSPWPLLFNADTFLYLLRKGQVSREDKQELGGQGDLDSNACSATSLLCNLGSITFLSLSFLT